MVGGLQSDLRLRLGIRTAMFVSDPLGLIPGQNPLAISVGLELGLGPVSVGLGPTLEMRESDSDLGPTSDRSGPTRSPPCCGNYYVQLFCNLKWSYFLVTLHCNIFAFMLCYIQ